MNDEDTFKTPEQLVAEAAANLSLKAPSPIGTRTPSGWLREVVNNAKFELDLAAERSRQRAAAFNDPFAKSAGTGTTTTVTPAVTPPPSAPRNAPKYKVHPKR